MPVVLGAGGMERVFEIELTAAEQAAFDASAAAVRELVGEAELTPITGSGACRHHEARLAFDRSSGPVVRSSQSRPAPSRAFASHPGCSGRPTMEDLRLMHRKSLSTALALVAVVALAPAVFAGNPFSTATSTSSGYQHVGL